MKTQTDTLLFQEKQRLSGVFIGLLLPVLSLPVVVLSIGLIQQLAYQIPFGNHPISDPGFILVYGAIILLCGTLIATLCFSRLITEVRPEGLFIRYAPFHRKFHEISLENLKDIQAVTYHPIYDYGGWGIRYGAMGKAYNVRGNRGVKIRYQGGHSLLIGSQKPEELHQAICSIVKL